MNRKQLILIFLALAVLGGASLLLLNRRDESWSAPQGKMGQKLFPNMAINDVAAIHIQKADDLHLEMKGGVWTVRERGGYPANFAQVKETILKLADLKIAQSEVIGPSQLGQMELLKPGQETNCGTLLELANAQGKVMQSALLGKMHFAEARTPSPYGGGSYPNGRYLLLGGDTQNLLVVSDPLNSIETGAEPWLDRDFFKVEKPRMISLQAQEPTNSWKLTRETESSPWALEAPAAGETLDSNKVASLGSMLSYPSFIDVASNTNAAETGLDKPLTVTIQTFDHFNYELKLGRKAAGQNFNLSIGVTADFPTTRLPGKDEKPEEKTKLDQEFQTNLKKMQDKLAGEKSLGKWVYVVNAGLFDPLVRNRAQLMVDTNSAKAEIKSDAPFSEPAPEGLAPAEPEK